MPRARARQFFSSGLGFGLETQKPGLGLGLETCWTRTRVLRIWTRDSRHADSDSTRTRGNEDSLHLCVNVIVSLRSILILTKFFKNLKFTYFALTSREQSHDLFLTLWRRDGDEESTRDFID